METPTGNPNISLLPQPAVPAPIEAMRGGGLVGGGSESVSLLPQPAVPVPIEPMRGGGGPEDVSLLPQPAVEAPIVPMKGGGDFPQARLITFTRKGEEFFIDEMPDDKLIITKQNVLDYYAVRGKVTRRITKTAPAGKKEFIVFSITMDNDQIIYVFFVHSLIHFLQIELKMKQILKNIKIKDEDKQITFLFINQIVSDSDFQKVYRLFIKRISIWNKTYNLDESNNSAEPPYDWFFLFDKQKLSLKWKSTEKPDQARAIFDYIEPDLISLNYKVGSEDKTLGIVPAERPKDNKDPLIGPGASENKLELVKGGKFDLRTLVSEKYYTTKKDDSKYWDSKFIQIDFSGELTIEEEAETVVSGDAPAASAAAAASASAAAATSPPPREEKPKQPPPPEKPKVTFIVSPKKTTTLELAGQFFEVRIPKPDVEKAWLEGIFEPEELRLFDTLGLTKEFFGNTGYEQERENLKNGRGELLWYLTASGCMKETTYLLASECSWLRDFLQILLEIRQFDRLRAISASLGSAEDFEAELQKAAAKRESGTINIIDEFFKHIFEGISLKRRTQILTPELLNELLGLTSSGSVGIDDFFASILDLSDRLRLREDKYRDPDLRAILDPLLDELSGLPTVKGIPTLIIDVKNAEDFVEKVSPYLNLSNFNYEPFFETLYLLLLDKKKVPTDDFKKYQDLLKQFSHYTFILVKSKNDIKSRILSPLGGGSALSSESVNKIADYVIKGDIKWKRDLPPADRKLYNFIVKYKYKP
jgi:hypothetical protein